MNLIEMLWAVERTQREQHTRAVQQWIAEHRPVDVDEWVATRRADQARRDAGRKP